MGSSSLPVGTRSTDLNVFVAVLWLRPRAFFVPLLLPLFLGFSVTVVSSVTSSTNSVTSFAFPFPLPSTTTFSSFTSPAFPFPLPSLTEVFSVTSVAVSFPIPFDTVLLLLLLSSAISTSPGLSSILTALEDAAGSTSVEWPGRPLVEAPGEF